MLDGYVPIRIRDFISGSTASSDVYVSLDGAKFVKILHKGQAFEPSRLSQYAEKNVQMLYLRNEDFSEYIRSSTRIGEALAGRKNVDPTACLRFLNRVADAVVTELYMTKLGPETIDHVRSINAQLLSSLQRKPDIMSVLKSLEQLGDDFARRSIGISLVSTILAIHLDWSGSKTLELIQLGAFLQDIGFRELPKELSMKARSEMTPEEVKLFETHPYRGAELLRSVPAIPAEVIAIVFEHHEHGSGMGFPRGIKGDRIFPLARLIGLADLYCQRALSSVFNPNPRSGVDVVDELQSLYSRDFPLNYWEALDQMVGREPARLRKRA